MPFLCSNKKHSKSETRQQHQNVKRREHAQRRKASRAMDGAGRAATDGDKRLSGAERVLCARHRTSSDLPAQVTEPAAYPQRPSPALLLFYRSQLVFASSTTSSPRPLIMARSIYRLKPFACSSLISGGITSSSLAVTTSTSTGPS